MIDPMRKCGKETKTTLYYPLHCNLYSFHREELPNDVCAVDSSMKSCHEDKFLITLAYEPGDFNNDTNEKVS